MENDGKMVIVVKLPLADTPDLREKVMGPLGEFIAETVTKITLDSIKLE